ncbi:MAG: hypothetical protein A2W52_02110 [Candidatus Taylorbacteria bacterium RIFCSPHIGHO2_02_49_25]|uniref:General secretion pathway GspH domain-containing protein n=1 Tax=Candidatus Taylorbacteria bacterium RIFCSPHIGHO2_02_49_25 TaxID=1802305 RepID=A0A1G2MKG2_9BACT|nr:MAG: hypothetical protein UY62_C0044G0006 [Parcubacteria group bacterium GW2011_GWF2_50_9]OHA20644.1 MAG: hypothetical protein A2759_01320 [Candidatus Taylorbacteria bacterium RIFCSPHIGHO2_01_FULL_49_60]OHA23501.1 MAG: hypothetical protein A2W52_02110 [Candidatus Taylorbacteria bacterium RIFCSPHIGHO2_02_49_25]OHA36324.1 MAG: hypothetical protein A3B27_01355 [Candidatus Taylorbacteria bacterium RIFCSPLOWO2_01_FULL_50_130]OHA36854.1 MAG: hypothetical protein A2W65_00100 [Candidatus Taylorbacte
MKGFTLLEVLLALSIAAVIAVISFSSLFRFNAAEALNVETERTLSLLSQARTLTLAAKDGKSFGVHFEERKAVLFSGASYDPNDASNEILSINSEVRISAFALTGGGGEALFKKLSGATDQSGTVTLALVRDPSKTRVITIAPTGLAYSN